MIVPDPTAEGEVVAADPTEPFEPRPLISELLRTRHCIPESVFLVEGIEAHIAVSKRYRTVRLLLGDGELCIQALLRSEIHRFVDTGSVFVGCYVRLGQFDVQSIDREPDGDHGFDDAVEMVYLVVEDMSTVGWNTTYMQMAGTTGQEAPRTIVGAQAAPKGHGDNIVSAQQNRRIAATGPYPGAAEAVAKQAWELAEEPKSDEEDAFESLHVPEQTVKDRRHETELLQQRPVSALPWAPSTLSKPLRLTPLKTIPHLPYKQNWAVNVLAVVTSLSDVEPALMPGYVGKQRTARLADPSTDKQVLLTVFLDPDEFAPGVDSVVLLLGVKNHRFDGGSLKKYGNEKPRPGTNWWFENPTHVEWCDVEGLKAWWSLRQANVS
jgi:hypothetical protein